MKKLFAKWQQSYSQPSGLKSEARSFLLLKAQSLMLKGKQLL
jgi:hypothetical protein